MRKPLHVGKTLRALVIVAALLVVGALWVLFGARTALIVAAVLAAPPLLIWGARKYPKPLAIISFTLVTPALIVWAASGVAAAYTGVQWLTLIFFSLAAPLGAWLVPPRRLARWVSVGMIDAGLLMVAAIAPATPTWTPVLALAVLVGPLLIQGLPARRVGNVHE